MKLKLYHIVLLKYFANSTYCFKIFKYIFRLPNIVCIMYSNRFILNSFNKFFYRSPVLI